MRYELASSSDALTLIERTPEVLSSEDLIQELTHSGAAIWWAVLDYAPPGRIVEIGAMVWDEQREHLGLVLRPDWRGVVKQEDLEYFEGIMKTFAQIRAGGEASGAIRFFEDSLSNVLRMRDPQIAVGSGIEAAAKVLSKGPTVETSSIDVTGGDMPGELTITIRT